MMPPSRMKHMKPVTFAVCMMALLYPGLAQAQSPPTIVKSFSAATVGIEWQRHADVHAHQSQSGNGPHWREL